MGAEKARKAGKKRLVIRRLSMRRIKNAVNLTLNNQRRLEALEKKADKKMKKALKKEENVDDLLNFDLDTSHDLNDDEEQRRLVNDTIKQTMEEMKQSKFKAKSAKKLAKSAKKAKRVLNKTPKQVTEKPAAKPAETPKKEEVRKLDEPAKTTSSNEGEKKQEESKDQKENKT